MPPVPRGPYPGPQPPGWGPPGPWGPPPPPPSRGRRIARIVFNPIHAANRAFKPTRPDRVQDPTVKKLQVWRTVLGLSAWIWLMVAYNNVDSTGKARELTGERFNQAWFSVLGLVATFPILVGAFVYATRGGTRRVYLRRSLKPLGAVAAVMGAMFSFVLAAAPEFEGLRDSVQDLTGPTGTVVAAVVVLWMVPFALYGVVLALVHVVRTADIHEFVPPVLAAVLVWEMAILDLAMGSYGQIPLYTRVGFILGAPVSVSLLATWEIYRLWRYHGLTLRAALLR